LESNYRKNFHLESNYPKNFHIESNHSYTKRMRSTRVENVASVCRRTLSESANIGLADANVKFLIKKLMKVLKSIWEKKQ